MTVACVRGDVVVRAYGTSLVRWMALHRWQQAALRAACAKRRYTPMRFIDGSIACGVREAPLHAYSVHGTTTLIGRSARERSVFFRVLQWYVVDEVVRWMALHRWQHGVREAPLRLFGRWHHNTDWQMRAKRVLQSPSMVSCRRKAVSLSVRQRKRHEHTPKHIPVYVGPTI